MKKNRIVRYLLINLSVIIGWNHCYGQSGFPDNSFSIEKSENIPTFNNEKFKAIESFPDGSTLIASSSDRLNSRINLNKFKKDGSLDTEFKYINTIEGATYSESVGPNLLGIKITKDSKIYLAGYSVVNIARDDFTPIYQTTIRILCLNEDGTNSPSFLNGLVVNKVFENSDIYFSDFLVHQDGRFSLLGQFSSSKKSKIYSFSRNGTYDEEYNKAGLFQHSISKNNWHPSSMDLQEDGFIRICGVNNSNLSQVFSMRITPNGTIDYTYGNDGTGIMVHTQSTYGVNIIDAELNNNDDICIMGRVNSSLEKETVFISIDKEGNNIQEFGQNGIILDSLNSRNSQLSSFIFNDDRSIYATGSEWGGANNNFIILKYNRQGTKEINFGIDGKVVYDFGYDEIGGGLLVSSDGRLIFGGTNKLYFQNIFIGQLDSKGNIIGNFPLRVGNHFNLGVYKENQNIYTKLVKDKILVTAWTYLEGKTVVKLCLFTSDGKPDKFFGNNGVKWLVVNSFNHIQDIFILNDGSTILQFNTNVAFNSKNELFLAKYNSDGVIDTSFHIAVSEYFKANFSNTVEIDNFFMTEKETFLVLANFKDLSQRTNISIFELNDKGIVEKSNLILYKELKDELKIYFDDAQWILLSDGTMLGNLFYSGCENCLPMNNNIIKLNENRSINRNFGTKGTVQVFNADTIFQYFSFLAGVNGFKVLGKNSTNLKTWSVVDYNTSGQLNKNYGVRGKQTVFNYLEFFEINNYHYQDDRNIILGFRNYYPRNMNQSTIFKVNSNFKLDSSFGINGHLATPSNNFAFYNFVGAQSSGKLICSYFDENRNLRLLRFYNDWILNSSNTSSKDKIVIFPNPGQGKYNLKYDLKNHTIASVYNIDGIVIKEFELNSTTSELNLEDQAPGIYYVRIGLDLAKLVKVE